MVILKLIFRLMLFRVAERFRPPTMKLIDSFVLSVALSSYDAAWQLVDIARMSTVPIIRIVGTNQFFSRSQTTPWITRETTLIDHTD